MKNTVAVHKRIAERRARQVEEPLTEKLLGELLAAPSAELFTQRWAESQPTLGEYLEGLLEERGLKRSEVVRAAQLNETFGYQIFKGQRGASRDKVLALAFAMNMSLRECNHALGLAGVNALYCKCRRDAIIIFCLEHGAGLQKVNEELYRFDEACIG